MGGHWSFGLAAPRKGGVGFGEGWVEKVFVGGCIGNRSQVMPFERIPSCFVSLRCVVLEWVGFTGVGVRRYWLVWLIDLIDWWVVGGACVLLD